MKARLSATAVHHRVPAEARFVDGAGEFEIAEHQINQDHWRKDTSSSMRAMASEGSKASICARRAYFSSVFSFASAYVHIMARMRAPLGGADVVRKKTQRTNP